jgi:hypothetical protein
MEDEDKIACRTPAQGRDGVTWIPAWKYAAVRRAILHAVDAAGAEGLRFAESAGGGARAAQPAGPCAAGLARLALYDGEA